MNLTRLRDHPALRSLARRCWPKTQWISRGAAEAQMRSLMKRDLTKNSTCHVYACPHCRFWHVGHHHTQEGSKHAR
jgi:hypothetical protein